MAYVPIITLYICMVWPDVFGGIAKNLVVDYTVDMERFTGLNVRGFSLIKVLAEVLSRCLGQKYILIV